MDNDGGLSGDRILRTKRLVWESGDWGLTKGPGVWWSRGQKVRSELESTSLTVHLETGYLGGTGTEVGRRTGNVCVNGTGRHHVGEGGTGRGQPLEDT